MTHKKASSWAQIIYFTSVKQNIPDVIVDLNGWSSLLLLNAIDWLQPHHSLQRTGDEPLGNSDNDWPLRWHLHLQSIILTGRQHVSRQGILHVCAFTQGSFMVSFGHVYRQRGTLL